MHHIFMGDFSGDEGTIRVMLGMLISDARRLINQYKKLGLKYNNNDFNFEKYLTLLLNAKKLYESKDEADFIDANQLLAEASEVFIKLVNQNRELLHGKGIMHKDMKLFNHIELCEHYNKQ